MRRIVTATLLLAACALGGAGSAQAGTSPAVPGAVHHTHFGAGSSSVVPGPIHHTTTPAFCQYDVFRGVLTVEKTGEANAGRYVSVKVTNNAGTASTVLHGYLRADNGDAIWTHGVWHTYTNANVAAWVSGHRCDGT